MKDTKEIILKTAYNMFLYNNYEAVTINSIIKATGLTKGGIYHYYASKEELFKAVVDKYMIENQLNNTNEYPNLKEFIQGTIDRIKEKITKLVIENPNFHNEIPINYLSLLVAAYRYYPGYTKIGNLFFKSQRDMWGNAIKKAMENNEIRSDIDTEACIANFMITGSGLLTNIMGNSVAYALDIMERQYWQLYTTIKK